MVDRAIPVIHTPGNQSAPAPFRRGLPRSITLAAIIALGLIIALTIGTTLLVWLWADFGRGLSPSDWAAIKFTLFQATLSAGASILLAIPLARALARRRFPGRSILLTLLGAPFILPVIVAVLGLLAVFGRNGILNNVIAGIGVDPISIFGLQGVVLAHVFFNMPLATRFFLQGWQSIPSERFRLSASLGFGSRDTFRHLEIPMLRATAPKAFLLIFVICLSSFAVALTLGGGPKASTIELAIYQAFTFEFDLARAARLSVLQIGIGVTAGALAMALTLPSAFGVGLDRGVERWDAAKTNVRVLDTAVIILAALFLIIPLIMVISRGLPYVTGISAPVYWAALRSVLVAMGSVVIMLALALPLAIWAARGRSAIVEGVGLLLISASPLVVGTGLFLLVFQFAVPSKLALPITAMVNAGAALPFALRALVPAVAQTERDFARLSASLAMPAWAHMRLVVLPRIRAPLAFSCALTGALSMGDLGVITLFSGADNPTLPLMVYRLMGAYRMDDAAAAALLLLILSLLLFWLFDQGARKDA